MRLQPLHNNLVLEEFELGSITRSGFLIPATAKASQPYRFAKVLEVGPGRRALDGSLVPVQAVVGDIVAYSKNRGVLFPLEGADGVEHEVRMINEQDILGIVKDMPEQSRITGLDGRLLTMNPGSRAPSDIAVEQRDRIERARHEGIIDSAGGTLDAMVDADRMDAESDA